MSYSLKHISMGNLLVNNLKNQSQENSVKESSMGLFSDVKVSQNNSYLKEMSPGDSSLVSSQNIYARKKSNQKLAFIKMTEETPRNNFNNPNVQGVSMNDTVSFISLLQNL